MGDAVAEAGQRERKVQRDRDRVSERSCTRPCRQVTAMATTEARRVGRARLHMQALPLMRWVVVLLLLACDTE